MGRWGRRVASQMELMGAHGLAEGPLCTLRTQRELRPEEGKNERLVEVRGTAVDSWWKCGVVAPVAVVGDVVGR
jgi:hypothetical protein